MVTERGEDTGEDVGENLGEDGARGEPTEEEEPLEDVRDRL